jgi:hypothetical protein
MDEHLKQRIEQRINDRDHIILWSDERTGDDELEDWASDHPSLRDGTFEDRWLLRENEDGDLVLAPHN